MKNVSPSCILHLPVDDDDDDDTGSKGLVPLVLLVAVGKNIILEVKSQMFYSGFLTGLKKS